MTNPLVILPNMEAVTSSFLREQPEIQALIPDGDRDARAYTAIPKAATYPLIRVTLIVEEKMTSRPLWVFRSTMQVEAYGGNKAQAHQLARTAEGVIAARFDESDHGDFVCAGVDMGSIEDIPDDEFEPARPRFLFVFTATGRPTDTVTS